MIYFIEDTAGGHVKIGFSAKSWVRFSKIQSDCPFELTVRAIIDGGVAEEAALHRRFSSYGVRGEWYRLTGELAAFVDGLPAAEKPGRSIAITTPGSAVCELRCRLGLSQAELAAAIGLKSKAYICQIEKGERAIPLPVAIALCRKFGLKVPPVADASEADLDVLERFLPKHAKARAA